MAANVLLPLVCSALACVFVVLLARRFSTQRRPYYAVWAVGLVCYGLSTAAEWFGATSGWGPGLYRLWYLSGAIGVAAYLGAGSVYLHREVWLRALVVLGVVVGSLPALLAGEALTAACGLLAALALAAILVWIPVRFADALLLALVAGSLLAALAIVSAPINVPLLPAPDEIATGQAFPPGIRVLTPLFNIPGALALLVGALASAVARGPREQVAANVLIAVGALVPSLTSGLTRFGLSSAFYLGELLGLLCILAGFVLSGATMPRPRRRPSA